MALRKVSPFATIDYEKRDALAWITLNRPEVHNALNTLMRDELWEVMHAVLDDPDVAVALFRGAGDSFSSGADISEFGAAPSYAEAREARRRRDLWGFMAYYPKPLIAAIHGYALGAGLELALFCDLRLCAEDAHLGVPEVTLAYIPAAGGTQTLPRITSEGFAREAIYRGDRFDAFEAQRLGMVHKVVPNRDLIPEAEAWANRLASNPTGSVRLAKEAIVHGLDMPLSQGLELEERLASLLLAAPGGVRADDSP